MSNIHSKRITQKCEFNWNENFVNENLFPNEYMRLMEKKWDVEMSNGKFKVEISDGKFSRNIHSISLIQIMKYSTKAFLSVHQIGGNV